MMKMHQFPADTASKRILNLQTKLASETPANGGPLKATSNPPYVPQSDEHYFIEENEDEL